MRMYKRMSFRISLLLCVILISAFGIMTAGAEEHISKRIATLGESYMDIDMDAPAEPPTTVPQIKLERIRFDRKQTKKLVEKYSIVHQKGEEWVCAIGSTLNPDYELYFREECGVYGSIAYDLSSPRTPLDETDEGQCRANAAARAFLDELGISYEYPFYYVAPLEVKKGDVRLIEIMARLTVDGMPCNTTIGWTRGSDVSGNGDPTPGAFLIVTENGELTTAVIRNPVNIVKTDEDQTTIRSWESVLEDNKGLIMEHFCTGNDAGSTLTLKQVEFAMMVDAHQNVYPAWAYCFHHYVPADPHCEGPVSYALLLTYDARTGREVWRCID